MMQQSVQQLVISGPSALAFMGREYKKDAVGFLHSRFGSPSLKLRFFSEADTKKTDCQSWRTQTFAKTVIST